MGSINSTIESVEKYIEQYEKCVSEHIFDNSSENKSPIRFEDCKYHSIKYTDFDIFGHDSYDCYCSLSGNKKEVSYYICTNTCTK